MRNLIWSTGHDLILADIVKARNCQLFSNIPFDKIGIFLFEPGSSSGLVNFPSAKLIERISKKITENDGLIVINEVTTGAGRTGKWFRVSSIMI